MEIEKAGENGVFITMEESPMDIRRNQKGFRWDIAAWETAGKRAFVDASPQPEQEMTIVGDYDFGALLARIEHAVRKVGGGKRRAMDSIGAIPRSNSRGWASGLAIEERIIHRHRSNNGPKGNRKKALHSSSPFWSGDVERLALISYKVIASGITVHRGGEMLAIPMNRKPSPNGTPSILSRS